MPTVTIYLRPTLRDLNARCTGLPETPTRRIGRVRQSGRQALRSPCGLDAPVTIEVAGHVGYYCAGMNKQAHVIINGNAGAGVAENMMSGEVRVEGDASSRPAPPAAAACWSSTATPPRAAAFR